MSRSPGTGRSRPGPAVLLTGGFLLLLCGGICLVVGWPWVVVLGILLLFCAAIVLVTRDPVP